MLNIYYANIATLQEEKIFEKGRKLLPAERLEKLNRIKTKEGRLCSMAAGLLLVYSLRTAGVSPQETIFEKNEDGKPFLKQHPALSFNLSHSGEYATIAIGDHEVGVDIEKPRYGMKKLVDRFFSPEEKTFLEAHWSDEEFTRFWTRKESYIKAVGKGMRMSLQEFSTIEDEVDGYFMQSFPIDSCYWLTVCQKGEKILTVPKELFLCDIIG